MKVFVAGATGVVGWRATRDLVADFIAHDEARFQLAEHGFELDADVAAVRALYREQKFAEAAPLLRAVLARAREAHRGRAHERVRSRRGCEHAHAHPTYGQGGAADRLQRDQ